MHHSYEEELAMKRAAIRSQKHFPAPAGGKVVLYLAKLKATKPRMALADFLLEAKDPMTVADIFSGLRKNKSDIDLATVYRTLEQLAEAGVVNEIRRPNRDHALYEIAYGRPHHHHAVCTSCSDMEDVTECEAVKLNERVGKKLRKFALIQSHSLEFFGLCKKCDNEMTSFFDPKMSSR